MAILFYITKGLIQSRFIMLKSFAYNIILFVQFLWQLIRVHTHLLN